MSLTNNKKSLIIACVLAGFILAALILLYSKSNKVSSESAVKTFNYVVAKAEIPLGGEITDENVEIKNFPIKVANAYEKKEEIIGQKSNCVISEGKPIVVSFLENNSKSKGTKVKEPDEGFLSFPVYMKKNNLPPYVVSGNKFDLKTKNNTASIDNVRILDIIEPEKSSDNRMLLLEININDVQNFIAALKESGGIYLLQKNAQNSGEYRYYKQTLKTVNKEINSGEIKGKIPKIPDTDNDINAKFLDLTQELKIEKPKIETVEVIVGNEKKVMGFKTK